MNSIENQLSGLPCAFLVCLTCLPERFLGLRPALNTAWVSIPFSLSRNKVLSASAQKSSRSISQCMGFNPFPKIYLHFFAGSLWSDDILSKETHCPRMIHARVCICNGITVSLTGAVKREYRIPCRRPVMQSIRCACLVQKRFSFSDETLQKHIGRRFLREGRSLIGV